MEIKILSKRKIEEIIDKKIAIEFKIIYKRIDLIEKRLMEIIDDIIILNKGSKNEI